MTTADADTINTQRNLGYFFAESVRRVPDKVCIIDLSGGTERSVNPPSAADRGGASDAGRYPPPG